MRGNPNFNWVALLFIPFTVGVWTYWRMSNLEFFWKFSALYRIISFGGIKQQKEDQPNLCVFKNKNPFLSYCIKNNSLDS